MEFQLTPSSGSPHQDSSYTPAPPPPPKPLTHSSGTGPPHTGPPPPLPPVPGRSLINNDNIHDYRYRSEGGPHGGAIRGGQGRAGLEEILQSPLPEPPDQRWLPHTLKDKSIPNLKTVFETASLQSALIKSPETTHPSLLTSVAKVQHVLSDNLALAQSLVALESDLRQRRESAQSRLLALRALERQWRTKEVEQDEALRNFSPPALYQRLNAAITKQEAYCRGLQERFLDGEADNRDHSNGNTEDGGLATEREVAEFIKRYREAVKVAYLRRQRKARWDEGRVSGWR